MKQTTDHFWRRLLRAPDSIRNTDIAEAVRQRREALRAGAAGAFAILGAGALPARVMAATSLTTVTPTETEGPYWVDEKLNRSDIRSDPTTGTLESGFDTRLTISLSKLANGKATPVSGAYIDIWHCNASGSYSDEAAGMGNANTQGEKYLRGYQVTSSHGQVKFRTIYPGWYSGRTPHIHARVRIYSGTTATTNFTTQFFFTESITNTVYANEAPYNTRNDRDTTNSTDSVYNTVSSGSTTASPDGSRLMLRMADDGSHVIASFNIVMS